MKLYLERKQQYKSIDDIQHIYLFFVNLYYFANVFTYLSHAWPI